ncbi:Alpha-1,3-mannosyltransferase CMT1 [Tolypocladium ophioglossoides CBS 100239]|uniref:Alpha-1,3-mannosyltransferase CMT1 n=1 Tax=Tolypocladium ophioglossoides (strain CBS 100239) TaxID=1163406 RepID=A0A0L0NGQ8_TOLOC|nr:Alpha-1,3-mannosyltransferase CMT1 [Tolypocladium ophioglossoides CBS 100239]
MRRRQLLLVAPLISLFFIAGSLYFGRDRLRQLPRPAFLTQHEHEHEKQPQEPVDEPTEAPTRDGQSPRPPAASELLRDNILIALYYTGPILPEAKVTAYLDAILARKPTSLASFHCPVIDIARYESLKTADTSDPSIRYFFALNLRQNLPLLPRLIGSIVEVIRFLGPQHCAVSIAEGNSPDGTGDVLAALRPSLEALGITYSLQSSPIDPSEGDRIVRLAELRNMALQPLLHLSGRANKDTTIIFLNDVAACPDDILELAFQRRNLGADMTCAMDWSHIARDPTFYDVWISRGINGDSFFEIPLDGSWDLAGNLFWNADQTRELFSKHRPFQVFSCWNGAVTFSAQPILENLRFRAANEEAGECFQGEPQLLCKDMWFRGYGKIAVVPTVNLEYSVDHGKKIKEVKGFASDLVAQQNVSDDRIEWQLDPPDRVKCMPSWTNQFWQPWNATLT